MIRVKDITIGDGSLTFIGGPCAIENEYHTLSMVERLLNLTTDIGIQFVFKSSYDKDSRSSIQSFHGVGLDKGIKVFQKIKEEFNVPIVTDFSNPNDAQYLVDVIDIIQVPAYLCRQTSILRSAAKTQLPVLVKKGQFMSHYNMSNSVEKLKHFGNENIILVDRGTFFGYNELINDFTSLPIMKDISGVVGYDATHSVQIPTTDGTISGGRKEFIPHLSKAAISVGIDVLFMEVHDNPQEALSDPNTVLDINTLSTLLPKLYNLHQYISSES